MAGEKGLSIVSNKFEGYKHCANDVIHFKLVRHESEIEEDATVFKPDMTHQLFGDSETIFGYKDLRINIYCTASRMITYVSVKYTDKVTPERFDGVQADNILKVLSDCLQPGFLTNVCDFTAAISKDATFKPFGEKIHEYSVHKAGEDRCFEIYKTKVDTPGFRDYHERMQPFLMFYVDAASYIDVDDERWTYYLLLERVKSNEELDSFRLEKYKSNGNPMYAFAGYMTVYNYYAYPEKVRPRVSQVLVMPPFQRQGHGANLLQTFYNDCVTRNEVLDITVEDPSENFQRVRDFVDVRNAARLSQFQPACLRGGFTEDMVMEARTKLKINKKQARRVYEILRLRATNCSSTPDYKAYRLDVKKRINMPFQKNGRDFEKLHRALNPNELAATLNNLTLEQRLEYLEKTFQELVTEYRHILDRVDMSVD